MGSRFLCPHCARLGGKIGGTIIGRLVCETCVSDYSAIRQVLSLIYEANPRARTSGKPAPVVILELFIAYVKTKEKPDLTQRAEELLESWKKA